MRCATRRGCSTDQNLVVGDIDVREVLPFVIVARVGGLDADGLRAGLERQIDDLQERQIVGVRAFVVAPADVQPHPVGGQTLGRRVMAAMLRSAILRNWSSVKSRCWLLRAEARSGASICRTKPASTMARYSVFITSASAST